MTAILEAPERYFFAADSIEDRVHAMQRSATENFYRENSEVLSSAFINVFTALERLGLPEEKKIQTAQEAVFLWSQAKLAQWAAKRDGNNSISGFNLGAAVGTHIDYPRRYNGSGFVFAAGANREPDTIAIATHAETSAIERLKGILDPLFIPHEGKFIGMITITNATPCGSCREEIYRHATSDQSLVFVITDKGEAGVNTISELFPVQFPGIQEKDIPRGHLVKLAKDAAQRGLPSGYQYQTALPYWGVAMETGNGATFSGHEMGDDAFWSASPVHIALAQVWLQGTHFHEKLYKHGGPYTKKRLRETIFKEVKRVVFYYEGPELDFYPSGRERQQLSILPENTEIYIVVNNGSETKAFKTTRKELLPGAFTA